MFFSRWFIALALLSSLFAPSYGAEKYVTAGGTITEVVFALGAGDQVVAVDQSSSFPKKIDSLPRVGYYRDLAAEGVLSTELTHLLALEGTGRSEALKQIRLAGVEVTTYIKPRDLDGLYFLIRQIGEDLDKHNEATDLIADIKQRLPEIKDAQGARGLFLISAGERGLIAAGEDTVPQLLFDYVGVRNVAQHSGFKGLGIESLAVSQPDFLVAPTHVVKGAGGKAAFCAQPSLALLKAAQTCRILIMDSLLALGMTPRIDQAIQTLDRFAYGE